MIVYKDEKQVVVLEQSNGYCVYHKGFFIAKFTEKHNAIRKAQRIYFKLTFQL